MITLSFPNGITKNFEVAPRGYEILEYLPSEIPVVALRLNNEICPLDARIEVNANVEPVTLASPEGANIYRRSLCFVLALAVHKLFPKNQLFIGNSIGYSYYCTLQKQTENLSENDVSALEKKMREICEANLKIKTEVISYEDAVTQIEKTEHEEAKLLLQFSSSGKVKIHSCDGYVDLYCTPIVHRTGILKTFFLEKYQDGFLLRFPATANYKEVPQFNDIPELFKVYSTYKSWGKRIGVSCVGQLNQKIKTKEIRDFIAITETLQTKLISDIADEITSRRDVKVVLIAGPSSSGKTTTSKKLSLQLRVMGFDTKVIELDNYFVDRTRTPRDATGQPDYECLEALDVPLLNQNLVDLFDGKEINLPSYDFKSGTQNFTGKTLKLKNNTILILEGIHGLNDKLTPLIPREKKFKLYLSALTQLNIDEHNRISTSDNRLIRRIVRDANYRGKDAAGTIQMWRSVNNGEKKHIFPFQNSADVMLNTALDYELSVLKVYAEPLLRAIKPTQKEYGEAARLLAFLDNFLPIPSTDVPSDSVIREFIGGSYFNYKE